MTHTNTVMSTVEGQSDIVFWETDSLSLTADSVDGEPPHNDIPNNENISQHTHSLPFTSPISDSRAEAQKSRQPETDPEKNKESSLPNYRGDPRKQPTESDDLGWSDPKWRERLRKPWWQSYRPVAWLVTIFLTIVLLTALHFGSGYIQNRALLQNPFPQVPVDDFDVPQRNIVRHETYKSIHGTFTLYDSVVLSTTSGSVHATIDLVPLDPRLLSNNCSKQDLRPAVVDISTISGSVHIGFTGRSRFNAYTRCLFITIKTRTGSMHATDILVGNGGTTEVTTETGGMHPSFVVLAAGPFDPISHLITRTGPRSQHVTVKALDGGGVEQGSLAALRSDHRSTVSGSLHVTYPSTWEGKVEGVSRTGSVKIKGRDMACQSEREGWFGKKKVCYRSRHRHTEKEQEAGIFLACEGTGSIHFKA